MNVEPSHRQIGQPKINVKIRVRKKYLVAGIFYYRHSTLYTVSPVSQQIPHSYIYLQKEILYAINEQQRIKAVFGNRQREYRWLQTGARKYIRTWRYFRILDKTSFTPALGDLPWPVLCHHRRRPRDPESPAPAHYGAPPETTSAGRTEELNQRLVAVAIREIPYD